MADCIFCRIVDKKAPADIVFENDRVLIFKDHRPQAQIHLLVCPKAHYATFMDAPAEVTDYLFKVCRALAERLDVANGFRLMINNGPRGGQIVFHLHIHFFCWHKELAPGKIDLEIP